MSPSSVYAAATFEGQRADQRLDAIAQFPLPADPAAHGHTLIIEIDGCHVRHRDDWHESKLGVVTRLDQIVHKPPSQGEIERARKAGRVPRGRGIVRDKAVVADAQSLEAFDARLVAEATRWGVERAARIVTIQDGAPWIEKLCQRRFSLPAADDFHQPPQLIQILDWQHAVNHLKTAATAIYGRAETAEKTAFVRMWESQLWEQGAADALVATLRDPSTTARASDASELDKQAAYFAHNAPRMKYPQYRAEGFPIGSGAVEGACGTVVKDRCCRGGMIWSRNGLSHCLALRQFRLNNRWHELFPRPAQKTA